jgi:hypothetical protein
LQLRVFSDRHSEGEKYTKHKKDKKLSLLAEKHQNFYLNGFRRQTDYFFVSIDAELNSLRYCTMFAEKKFHSHLVRDKNSHHKHENFY